MDIINVVLNVKNVDVRGGVSMVAIKDMEMPKNCISCPLYVGKKGEGHCTKTHKWNAIGGINRLNDCPLVEIEERKAGEWIKSEIGGAKVCSICQSHMGLSNFKYCPNCGAEMIKE